MIKKLQKLLQLACDEDGRDITVQIQTHREENCFVFVPNTPNISNLGSIAPAIYFNKNSDEPEPLIAARIYKEYLNAINDTDKHTRSIKFAESLSTFNPKNIVPKLVNIESNKERLKKSIHTKFLDLALVYCVAEQVEEYADERLSSDITQTLLDIWGVDIDTIHKCAMQNLNTIYASLKDVMRNKFYDSPQALEFIENTPDNIFIVTNQAKWNGAASMLDTEVLSLIAEKFDSDLVIIPSSVHEILVAPLNAPEFQDINYVTEMIQSVNETEVAPHEILSDHAYIFDKEDKKVIMA